MNDLNTEEPIVFTMDKEGKEEDLFVHATSEGGDTSQVTFVDDCLVAVAVAEALPPPDEYETDSGDDFSDREDEDIAPVTVSRSGRPIRSAPFRLDLQGTLIVDMFHVSQEKTYFVCYSLPNASVWASAIFPDYFIPANNN